MERVKKNFGFGCMRLPMIGEKVDEAAFCKMIDYFIEHGFNYFDTAHPYLKGESEKAIKKCLTSRYPRDAYVLADKLTSPYFDKTEEIKPLVLKELELCGVSYFDFFLLHAQGRKNYPKYRELGAYKEVKKLKEEGYIRHIGLSFHDTPEYLEMILTENPFIEFVQIQLNYLDWENPGVQSREVYEVCRRHNLPVIVMEPVKGGTLANLPEKGKKAIDDLNGGSPASYAIRFAAGLPGVFMVLSGMSDMAQMKDNVSFMENFKPLNDEEKKATDIVVESFMEKKSIPCTGCSYCVEENSCPMNINIPALFKAYNAKKIYDDGGVEKLYNRAIEDRGLPNECIQCGMCESVCPQSLPIREHLIQVSKEFIK